MLKKILKNIVRILGYDVTGRYQFNDQGYHLSKLLRFHAVDVVFDIGANSGLFSLLSISKGAKKVYAFEPTPNNVNHLKETFKWDENVSVIGKAISNKTETKTFYLHTHSVGNSLNNVTK